jgi:hypothetical protein
VTVPASIVAGSTVTWIEPPALVTDSPATSDAWTLQVSFRTNTAGEGATAAGTARADGGWDVALSATTTESWDAGTWYWQRRVTSGAVVVVTGSGTTEVQPSLAYIGDPTAFDGRSQAEQDLDAAKQYSIGNRSYTSNDLGLLMQREAQLKAIVARERAAEKIAQGLGDPRNVFVRF